MHCYLQFALHYTQTLNVMHAFIVVYLQDPNHCITSVQPILNNENPAINLTGMYCHFNLGFPFFMYNLMKDNFSIRNM